MNRYNILANYPQVNDNVIQLEDEGKTVVVLAIDNIPQLIITLQEKHLVKPES